MSIQLENFGVTSSGEEITLFRLKNKNGMEADFINYGAILVNLLVPDKNGTLDDVVLGYEDVASYEKNIPGFGAFIGRYANRIGGACCKIGATEYKLEKNDGENNLHSGSNGFQKVIYETKSLEEEHQDCLIFKRLSPSMEQGFPGNLQVTVTYTLTDENELKMEYNATTDEETIINLTNHSYFNLAGHNSGSVLNHYVWIDSDFFTNTDESLIPTGELVNVEGTPLDFRVRKELGKEINQDYIPLKIAGGYDHNFVLKTNGKEVKKVAELVEKKSGRCMEVYTNKPGLQLYSANFLVNDPECKNKEQALYQKRAAVCFETQCYPNSCNISNFPNCFLKPGEEYNDITIYKFLF